MSAPTPAQDGDGFGSLTDEAVVELARQAWETNSNRMLSWHEVTHMARAVLCTAVRLGAEAACKLPLAAPSEAPVMEDHPPKVAAAHVAWDGPLFYPPVGKIAVMSGGDRIEVWPDEGEHQGCFTGLLLKPGRSIERQRAHDMSCMWDRKAVDHIEEPSEADKPFLVHWHRALAKGLSFAGGQR